MPIHHSMHQGSVSNQAVDPQKKTTMKSRTYLHGPVPPSVTECGSAGSGSPKQRLSLSTTQKRVPTFSLSKSSNRRVEDARQAQRRAIAHHQMKKSAMACTRCRSLKKKVRASCFPANHNFQSSWLICGHVISVSPCAGGAMQAMSCPGFGLHIQRRSE